MKKFTWFLFITLALAACSRKSPTPTIPPTPTRSNAPTATARATPTPLFSPTPRVTIVPSATRLQPAAQGADDTPSASPTSTDEPTPTLVPSSTPTIAVIDAGPATDTPSPTATTSDSPLPAPTRSSASEDTATETPLPTQTPSSGATSRPTAEAATATNTPTPQPTSSEDASPTPTFTLTPQATSTDEPESEADWDFENVWTYFDQDYLEFYVWGEVVNNATTNQRIVEFSPLVYDEDGIPINSELYFLPEDYDLMMTTVSVAPDGRLPFSFVINLPQYVASIEDNYEILVSSEPAEATRDDLNILSTDNDGKVNWPDEFSMWGSYENPGPDLVEYAAFILTLFDDEGRVIGVGMQFDTHTSALEAGEHDFQVIVETWFVTLDMNLYMSDYPRLQLLAY